MSKVRNIALSCGHALEFEIAHLPKSGETLWCPRCRRVESQETDCYIAKCQHCRYSRNFGRAIITAQTKAGKHAFGRPGHLVHVIRGRAIISKHRTSPKQLTLDDLEKDLVPPPF